MGRGAWGAIWGWVGGTQATQTLNKNDIYIYIERERKRYAEIYIYIYIYIQVALGPKLLHLD